MCCALGDGSPRSAFKTNRLVHSKSCFCCSAVVYRKISFKLSSFRPDADTGGKERMLAHHRVSDFAVRAELRGCVDHWDCYTIRMHRMQFLQTSWCQRRNRCAAQRPSCFLTKRLSAELFCNVEEHLVNHAFTESIHRIFSYSILCDGRCRRICGGGLRSSDTRSCCLQLRQLASRQVVKSSRHFVRNLSLVPDPNACQWVQSALEETSKQASRRQRGRTERRVEKNRKDGTPFLQNHVGHMLHNSNAAPAKLRL